MQGVEAAEIDVGLRETGRPRAELLAELRRGFATLPGTNVTIGQPISHRIDHMLSGIRANIGDERRGTLRMQYWHDLPRTALLWRYATQLLPTNKRWTPKRLWRELRQPLVRASKVPQRDNEGRTIWVTRARPKVVRVACPWLIRRFIDPRAIFLFVPPGEVAGVAEHARATPFDVDGTF